MKNLLWNFLYINLKCEKAEIKFNYLDDFYQRKYAKKYVLFN